MVDSRWTMCLDGAKRIERDGEVVVWLYERKWELLLTAVASAAVTPVRRPDLAVAIWGDHPNGRQILSETCFELKAKLREMGAPEDSMISERYAIRLGPGFQVQPIAS